MSYEERANARPNLGDDSDVEEEALVNDYREQVNFEDGMSELDRTTSLGAGSQTQDLQAQLAAAATPLEYQATLETKFASYDNYCSLFHYILNSEGPVDLEVPSVCFFRRFYPGFLADGPVLCMPAGPPANIIRCYLLRGLNADYFFVSNSTIGLGT